MFDVTSIPCASSFILAKAPNFNRLPAFIKAGLIHSSKFLNVRSQKFHQRMIVCDLLKAKANSLFLEAEIKEATLYYEQALSIYRYIMPKSLNTKPQNICDEDLEFIDFSSPKKEENIIIRELKVALYNNLAACYIKLKEYPNAISACNEVLLIDPNKTKALYRRAKALTLKGNAGLIEYRAANDDLKAAHKLDPKDQAVEQLYTKVKSELANIEKSQGIYVNDSGGPRDRRELERPIQEEHKSKPKNVEEKKTSGNNNMKNKQQEKVVPTKKTEKVEIKQEKVIREKREEEKREETESTLHTESGEMEGKFDGNDVWKMLHGDVDPNSQDFSYSLSFEIDSKIKVPEEIQEFGRYIQKRGKEVMALYEKTGRKKEILTLKENLKNAINTHKRIENIARLNFSKPTARLRETATRLNLDLNDPGFQQELRKMQEKNLDDVRNWLKAAKVTPATNKKGNGNVGNRGSSSSSLGLLGFIIKLFSGNENKNSLITTVRSNESPNLKEALEKGVTQKELETLLNKGMTLLKFVFWCIVILFALFVLIRSQNQEKQPKIGENPSL